MLTHFYIIAVKGCSFVEGRMRNCIFCPLSLSVMFIVLFPACMYIVECNLKHSSRSQHGQLSTLTRMVSRRSSCSRPLNLKVPIIIYWCAVDFDVRGSKPPISLESLSIEFFHKEISYFTFYLNLQGENRTDDKI